MNVFKWISFTKKSLVVVRWPADCFWVQTKYVSLPWVWKVVWRWVSASGLVTHADKPHCWRVLCHAASHEPPWWSATKWAMLWLAHRMASPFCAIFFLTRVHSLHSWCLSYWATLWVEIKHGYFILITIFLFKTLSSRRICMPMSRSSSSSSLIKENKLNINIWIRKFGINIYIFSI